MSNKQNVCKYYNVKPLNKRFIIIPLQECAINFASILFRKSVLKKHHLSFRAHAC